VKRREEKRREEKGREGKGREGKGREEKRRERTGREEKSKSKSKSKSKKFRQSHPETTQKKRDEHIALIAPIQKREKHPSAGEEQERNKEANNIKDVHGLKNQNHTC